MGIDRDKNRFMYGHMVYSVLKENPMRYLKTSQQDLREAIP